MSWCIKHLQVHLLQAGNVFIFILWTVFKGKKGVLKLTAGPETISTHCVLLAQSFYPVCIDNNVAP